MDDEAELLGGAEDEATRQISQEEEDALLNGVFEPTTASAAAAADEAATPAAAAAASDPPAAIVDPLAEVADPTAVADEDDLMNDDSESSKSSEERREPSQDVPISSNASESDDVDLSAHTATAEELRNCACIRSIWRVEKQRREATLERFNEKLTKMKQRVTQMCDAQRSRLAELQEEQSSISKQVKEAHSHFAHLGELPAKEQAPGAQPLVLPSAMMRRSAPSAGAQRLHQLQLQQLQQRNQQRMSNDDAGPSTSRGVVRRLSSDNAMPSTGRAVAVMRARKSTGGGFRLPGPSNGAAGPARAAVQSQQAQAIVNAQQAVAAASATAAARMLAAASSSPLQARQQQQSIKMSPHASQRQTATTTPQSQQAAAISAALAAGSRPAAATPPAMQQQQLQTSRKRPLEAGDGHPAMQQTRNGQQPLQPQRQMPQQQQQPGGLRTSQQLQHMQQAVVKRPMPACSPDADPDLRELAAYISSIFQRQHTYPGMEELHTKVYGNLNAACRLEAQIRDARNAPRPMLQRGLPTTDNAFVVPPDGSARKICVDLRAPWLLALPQKRPSTELPIASVHTKDKHAPRVVIASDHRDFAESGKLSGTVYFTPSNDWPETTARICIFFYMGTQNTGTWSRSEFATADCTERDANGNCKEATVRLTVIVDKAQYFAKNEMGQMNPNVKFETFGVVPVACAGVQVVRGDEASFDYEKSEQECRQKKFEMMKGHLRTFIQQDKRKMAGRQLQPQPPAARPPRPAAADDDIIEL